MKLSEKDKLKINILKQRISESREELRGTQINRIINFDSLFRPIKRYVDICNPYSKYSNVEREGESTDYTIILSEPLRNVLKLTLNSLEILIVGIFFQKLWYELFFI